MNIDGQSAIVNGGGSGLGEAVARELARQGAKVAVLDVNEAGAQRVPSEIGGIAVRCDITDSASVSAALDAAQATRADLVEREAEQTVRDSRIAMICEGTNEIQAIDLVQRKLLDDGGARSDALLAELEEEVSACGAVPAVQPFADALAGQLQNWRVAQLALQQGAADDPEWPLRAADDVLNGIGHALMCWAWARIARCALDPAGLSSAGGRSAEQWLQSARFGLAWLMPQAQVHWARARQFDAALPHVAS